MKIYFAGSIRGGREDRHWYQQIVTELRQFGDVLTEHIGDVALGADGDKNMTVGQIYERDMQWLMSADVVVAEVSTPSLGVGYELRVAEERGIPVLCLYNEESGRSLSAMIAGNPYLASQVIRYAGQEPAMLAAYLAKFFRSL
jgi:nucleoside 2-deoxyribosyltransferase